MAKPPPKYAGKPKAKPKTKGSKPKNKGGRPSSYEPAHVEQAYKYALLGLTGIEMADLFGVSERTFELWKKKYPEFYQSIKDGGKKADAQVASRLYERACGYVAKVEQAFKIKTGKDQEEVKIVTLEQENPPDTKAATLWLSNRSRDRWRDKQTIEVENGDALIAELQAGRERANKAHAQAQAKAAAKDEE